MKFTEDQVKALTAKLDASCVKKNPRGYDYVEGWHAIAEANRIFGHDGWSRELTSLVQVAPSYEVNGRHRVAYRATVRVTVYAGDTQIVREGTGYGSGILTDLNDAHESAVKEAETDAMKRALMTFGNPFGLALYDKKQDGVAKPSEDEQSAAELAAMNAINASESYEALSALLNREKDNFSALPGNGPARVRELARKRMAALKPAKEAA